jgi:hypothetical protein
MEIDSISAQMCNINGRNVSFSWSRRTLEYEMKVTSLTLYATFSYFYHYSTVHFPPKSVRYLQDGGVVFYLKSYQLKYAAGLYKNGGKTVNVVMLI